MMSFSWRNYTKPTPRNLEALAASLRRLVAIVAGTSLILEANEWVTLSILLLGAALDELKNFFSTVNKDYQKVVSINIPPSAEQDVEITNNENKEDEKPE